MPKNFQTSQYDEPIAFDGHLDVELEDGSVYRVEIERAHMEEDTGKSLHVGGSTGRIHGADYSLVDYNRAGIPLIEIVTKPLTGAGERAPEVAKAYVGALRELLRALEVSDVRMEQGSMRCDANVSLRPKAEGDDPAAQDAVPLGTRTETKNVNSLRSVERAIRYEITRHAAILAGGGSILQETRHWHEDTGVTTSGRPKSDADDYRYFPEPDLVPVAPDPRAWVEALRGTLPEPPPQRRRRLQQDWGFSDLEMRDVVNAGAVELIEASVAAGATPAGARKWWTGEIARRANVEARATSRTSGSRRRTSPSSTRWSSAGRLNDSMARQVLDGVLAGEGTPTAGRRRPWAGAGQRRRRARRGGRRGHRRQPRRGGQDPRRQGPGRRRAHRPGHEADEGPGRRGQGARAHPGAARRRRLTPAAAARPPARRPVPRRRPGGRTRPPSAGRARPTAAG